MRTFVLLFLAASVLAFASAPVASAEEAWRVYCRADAWVWHADYACYVQDAGTGGTVSWCPRWDICGDQHVLGCHVDTTIPWYCW